MQNIRLDVGDTKCKIKSLSLSDLQSNIRLSKNNEWNNSLGRGGSILLHYLVCTHDKHIPH